MATYFVSPNGSDSSGNGSLENPWKTIGKGVSALERKDTLSIRGGTYVEPPIAIGVTNVTVTNYLNEKVILDAQKRYPTGEVSETPMITLRADDVTVQGITVKNSMGRGFTIQEADNCTVKNCISSWSMTQAMVCYRAYNAVVDSCLFEQSTQIPTRNGGSVAFRKCDSSTIKNSIVRNSPGEGINYFLGINGRIINNTVYDINKALIYFENANGMLIDSNRLFYSASAESRGEGIHQEQEEADQYGGSYLLTGNNTIINNIVVNAQYNLLMSGGMHNGEEIPGYGFKDIKIANNTFINATVACVYLRRNDDHDPSDNTASWFTNNILIQDDNKPIFVYDSRDIDKFTFANNYFSKDPGSAKIRGTDSLIGDDIKLVKYDAAIPDSASFDPQNYQLTSSSPAIDAGTSDYPPDVKFDNFGNLRDAKPDIGAHEFVSIKESIEADFSASPLAGVAPLKVSFTDKSIASQPITSWFWDFGDGAISTEKNPQHEYNQGSFSVSLRVATESVNDIVSKQNFITVQPPEINAPPRVSDGLAVLYRFDEGSGESINDVSGVGRPLDLRITEPAKTFWLRPGLKIESPTVVASTGPAEKINEACRQTNEISLETWLKAENTTQKGPARIVSISQNTYSRNITLGQGLWGTLPSDLFDVRLRTTERSANGMPSFSTSAGALDLELRHVVFTRESSGRARIYIDGTIVAEATIPGDFSTWNPRFPLLIGNETTADNPWLGEIYLMAIYNRALSDLEVRKNRDAGIPIQQFAESKSVSIETFKRFVIVSNGAAFTTKKTLAFGVQYPDQRCVVCINHGSNGMTIYEDVRKVLGEYDTESAVLQWLD